MAVSIQAKDPNHVLKAFGVQQQRIEIFESNGGKVEIVKNGIELRMGLDTQNVYIKDGALSMALSGKLGAASLASLEHKITEAMKVMIYAAGASGTKTGTTKKSKAKAYLDDSPLPASVGVHNVSADPVSVMNGVIVKLADAQDLYQPVKGTSGSSKYFLVARTADLNIAARYKGTTLSLRCEAHGGDLKQYKHSLTEAGFGMSNINNGYVSVHMEVGDTTLASKTLGAVLGALQTQIMTPVPNMQLIANQGA